MGDDHKTKSQLNFKTEEDLRRSEQRYRTIVSAMSDMIFVFDEEDRFIDMHCLPDVPLYLPPEKFMGRKLQEVMPPENKLLYDEASKKLRESGITQRYEYPLHVAGEDKWFAAALNLHEDAKSIVCTISDITERRRAEEEKQKLERQVQHSQKLESLGVLAGGIAHDFNNMLLAILGNVELALNKLSPMSPARQNLKEIEKVSMRAAELAKQMLAYSGKGKFIVQPIDATELVEEMAHLLNVSISKKAILKYDFTENLPSFDGDVTQIRQVIMNLITNASEAIGDQTGIISLSTGVMECDRGFLDSANGSLFVGLDEPLDEGIYAYIEVTDTGCGMDAETINKVFDPFFTTKFTGRGLGMSAVLGIVRSHNGAIKVRSELDKGTTFTVLFPANEGIDDYPAFPKKESVVRRVWSEGQTALLVDDEEAVCDVSKQMLELLGFSVLTASDGRDALKVFSKHNRDIACVLLDLTMPHSDGEETFDELRRINPDVKVILCSGYSEEETTQRFVGKGLAGFIQKPFNLSTLSEKLSQVLPSP
jgi:PAS domain S-box-containing protein